MATPIIFEYAFTFLDGQTKAMAVALDPITLAMRSAHGANKPLWTLLNHKRCAICRLDVKDHAYCPVALNLSEVAEQFRNVMSHEEVAVRVTTAERIYTKETTIQHGLSPLVGLIMATSGCPALDYLKPIARFHLPFASLEETIFRMVSMHLVAQYFRSQEGFAGEWNLDGLNKIYKEVGVVNRDFAARLRDAARHDANLNALVHLDCFAAMFPIIAENTLASIRPSFDAYFRSAEGDSSSSGSA